MKKLSGFLIVVLFAMLTVAAWSYANRPTSEPALPRVIHGFAFQPYQKDQDAIARDEPTTEQVDSDLKLLAGKTNSVRTYSTLGSLIGIEECPSAESVGFVGRASARRQLALTISLPMLPPVNMNCSASG